MRAANPWTPERVAVLEQLRAQGESARTIAAQLGGISRSAVLGKIFRLRAEAAASAPAADQQTREDSQPSEPTPVPVAAPELPANPPPVQTRGKSLVELDNNSCRWPHGRPGSARFHFCGAPGADLEGGMPYCPRHARRAYRQHPAISEIPKLPATEAVHEHDSDLPRRRYVWRGAVRRAAARWK